MRIAKKVVRKKAVPKKQQGMNVIPIVFIAFGILFVLSIWTPWCGLFGKWVKNIFTGLFGNAAYIELPYVCWQEKRRRF